MEDVQKPVITISDFWFLTYPPLVYVTVNGVESLMCGREIYKLLKKHNIIDKRFDEFDENCMKMYKMEKRPGISNDPSIFHDTDF